MTLYNVLNHLEANLGPWVVKYRWWIIFTTVIVVSFLASGMRFLSYNMDNRIFFSEDNPQLQALDELENVYTKKYNVLFIIASNDGDIFTPDTLAAIEELTATSWKMP